MQIVGNWMPLVSLRLSLSPSLLRFSDFLTTCVVVSCVPCFCTLSCLYGKSHLTAKPHGLDFNLALPLTACDKLLNSFVPQYFHQ